MIFRWKTLASNEGLYQGLSNQLGKGKVPSLGGKEEGIGPRLARDRRPQDDDDGGGLHLRSDGATACYYSGESCRALPLSV